jgi:hypothetical protein
MKQFNILFYGLIAFIAAVVIISPTKQQNKGNTATISGKEYDIIKYVVDTQYYPHNVYKKVKGDTIFRDTTIYVDGTIDIDTNAILKDYMAKAVYLDTLHMDSLGYIAVRDTIQKNSIFSREYKASLKYPVISKEMIVTPPKRLSIYGGITPAFDPRSFVNSITVNLLVKTKQDRIFTLGAGIDHQANTVISIGSYWKIK